ncbi:MAG: type II toxin-antitoxin system RelE/ParE family toxin [Elusimicrobia bacterium]|nr:type II toxin-antitoxin system RelE/ParE family toxin [Elusimicrobiota bacterium]
MKPAWTRLALADLDNACGYIAEENPSAALRVVERIEKAVDALRLHPEIGRPGRVGGTRELVITGTPFIVAYRIKDERLEVLAVIHGARRWPDVM